jgi:hypothetical protein
VCRPVTSAVSALSGCVANGHQALHYVSSSPSKIPYGGFSPVRLQTALLHRNLRQPDQPGGLYAVNGTDDFPTLDPALCRAGRKATSGPAVQRPLARQRVLLSRQVIAYYGLIRGSGPLPTTYSLRRQVFALRPRPGDSLLCSAYPSVRAVCRTPVDRAVMAASSATRNSLRPSARGSASTTPTQKSVHAWLRFRGCTVRFMLRPGQLLALHRHRTVTFELSSHELPRWDVEYDYTAKQPITVAGLSPAGQAALQAATQISQIGADKEDTKWPVLFQSVLICEICGSVLLHHSEIIRLMRLVF